MAVVSLLFYVHFVHNSTSSSSLSFGFGKLKNGLFFANFREKAEEIARIRSELKEKGLLILRMFTPKMFPKTDTCIFKTDHEVR